MFQQQKPQLGTDLSSNLNLHHKSLNSQNSFELHTIVEAFETFTGEVDGGEFTKVF